MEKDGSEVGAGEVAVVSVGIGAQVLEAGAEDAGFGEVHAALAPEGDDEFLDEGLLGGPLGGEVFQEGVAEGVELVGVLVGEDGEGGGEAVFEGIEARAGLAFGGTRAAFAAGDGCWVLGVGWLNSGHS